GAPLVLGIQQPAPAGDQVAHPNEEPRVSGCVSLLYGIESAALGVEFFQALLAKSRKYLRSSLDPSTPCPSNLPAHPRKPRLVALRRSVGVAFRNRNESGWLERRGGTLTAGFRARPQLPKWRC